MSPEGRLRKVRNRIEQLGRVAAITVALTPSAVHAEQKTIENISSSHVLTLDMNNFTTGGFVLILPDEKAPLLVEEIIPHKAEEKVEALLDMEEVKENLEEVKQNVRYKQALVIHDRIIEDSRREEETRIATENRKSQRLVQSALNAAPQTSPNPAPQQPTVTEQGQVTQMQGGEDLLIVLADCETGDGQIGPPYSAQWSYDGSSGFDGGLQFLPSTWASRGTGYPFAWQAPPEIQMREAQEVINESGIDNQFPGCAVKMRAGGILSRY